VTPISDPNFPISPDRASLKSITFFVDLFSLNVSVNSFDLKFNPLGYLEGKSSGEPPSQSVSLAL
jgi:hypothetical protein